MTDLYLDPNSAAKLTRRGDRHRVLAAVNEYELLQAFGTYQSLYGMGEAPSAAYVARTQLVMAGRAEAERKLNEDAANGSGSVGSGGTADAPGTHKRSVSATQSGEPYRRRQPLTWSPPGEDATG